MKKQIFVLLLSSLLTVSIGCSAREPLSGPTSTAKLLFPHTTNSIGIALVRIPAGTFLMGSKHLKSTGPIHKVTLSSFWMSQYDVTNAQFERFRRRGRPPESLGDRQPVTRISYPEAVDFCLWLSRKERKHYRLPTEAEWEYAARGGLVQKDYPWGDDDPEGRATLFQTVTTPVGTYAPNGYGLYDMAGNVENWTSDWFDETYYAHSPLVNPKGPPHPVKDLHGVSLFKVARGGSFSVGESYVWLRQPDPIDMVPDPKKMSSQDEEDGSGLRIVLDDGK